MAGGRVDQICERLLARLDAREPRRAAAARRVIESARERGESATTALVDARLVTSLDVAEETAAEWGLDVVDAPADALDLETLAVLPFALARRHRVVVLELTDDVATVGTVDPGDIVALDDVRAATGRQVRPVIMPEDSLRRALDRHSRAHNDLRGVTDTTPDRTSEPVESDEPVIRYVNALLARAIAGGASDIHIEPLDEGIRVRFRIDGVLHEIERVPTAAMSALITRLKVMASLDIAERRLPQGGRISFVHERRVVDLRLATTPTVRGEKAVLRVLDGEHSARTLDDLDMAPRNLENVRASLARPHGLVLVTGPTGSGKSTTLYAALQELSSPEKNVVTVEDPVEYRLDGVNQMQINAKAGLTFAAALPSILRADPDVLLVGEVRDRATAQLAIEAALTGHLVMTTLHTNDAASAATRLTELGVEPFLLASSLDLIVAQRLARRLCGWCRDPYEPADAELERLGWPVDAIGRPPRLWRAVGCRACGQTGYQGRIALHETIRVTDPIQSGIVTGAPTHELRSTARAEGMLSLREDGFAKAAAGATTTIEVLRVAV